MATNILDDATRFDEQYACPDCGGDNLYSPTFRSRRCADCGHRGGEGDFRTTPERDCPDCGNAAPKTHERGDVDVYTCRACYNQFEG